MSDKNTVWIEEILIPAIISRKKSDLKFGDNVILKESIIKQFDNDGVFMMTICYKLTIVLDVSGDEHKLSVFVKMTPVLEEEYYHSAHFEELFRDEVIAYDAIIPSLKSAVDFPTLHYSHIGHLKAVIALSDFSADGFKMSSSVVNLPLDHILASMKALGRFHGASFAMKQTNPNHFDSLKNQLTGNPLQRKTDARFALIIQNAAKRALKSFRASTEVTISEVPVSFLHDLELMLIDKFTEYRYSLSVPQEPQAVICHGDFLRNNVAFKYDSNGMATDAMFFDLQYVVYASPMLDFGFFMANSTGHNIRQRHFDEIFRTYHDAVINQFLEKTYSSIEEIPEYLSRDAFMRDYVRHAPFCVRVAAYYLAELTDPQGDYFSEENITSMPEKIFTMGGEAVDRETSAQILEIYQLCERYKVRLSDIIGDIHEA